MVLLALMFAGDGEVDWVRTKPAEWPESYRERTAAWRKEELPRQQARFKESQTRLRQNRANQKAREQLEYAKAAMAAIKSKSRPLEPMIYGADRFGQTHEMTKGSIGRFMHNPETTTYRVEQILGAEAARIQVIEHWKVFVGGGGGSAGTFNAGAVGGLGVPSGRMVAEDRNGPHFILSGIDTAGWIDGQEVVLDDIYECTGNETYATVIGGSNTILSVRRIPKDSK